VAQSKQFVKNQGNMYKRSRCEPTTTTTVHTTKL
jgi:hypothetical protein